MSIRYFTTVCGVCGTFNVHIKTLCAKIESISSSRSSLFLSFLFLSISSSLISSLVLYISDPLPHPPYPSPVLDLLSSHLLLLHPVRSSSVFHFLYHYHYHNRYIYQSTVDYHTLTSSMTASLIVHVKEPNRTHRNIAPPTLDLSLHSANLACSSAF
jgi:hypothetical protein